MLKLEFGNNFFMYSLSLLAINFYKFSRFRSLKLLSPYDVVHPETLIIYSFKKSNSFRETSYNVNDIFFLLLF